MLQPTKDERLSLLGDQIFPADLTGKRVLEVGFPFGVLSFEAVRRGADQVIAIDIEEESIRNARQLARRHAMPVQFKQLDVERESIGESFDYVLALGVLTHSMNPLATLNKLADLTTDTLILGVPHLSQLTPAGLKPSWLARRHLTNAAGIYPLPAQNCQAKFYITPAALSVLISSHQHAFAQPRMIDCAQTRQHICIARRRHINELLVVAGPSACGKSTLIAHLGHEPVKSLFTRLGLGDSQEWEAVSTKGFVDIRRQIDRLVLHYDIMRPFKRGSRVIQRDEALDIFDSADKVHYLTLWTRPRELLRRVFRRLIADPNERNADLHKAYTDPKFLIKWYRSWLDCCTIRPGRHSILSLDAKPKFYSRQEWEEEVQSIAS